MEKRRIFLRCLSTAAVASAAGVPLSLLAATEKVDPASQQAQSLGYVTDTAKVNEKRYPKHQASQHCSNCQFYQASQQADNYAPCTVFGGKAVAANGWCSAWVAKAGG